MRRSQSRIVKDIEKEIDGAVCTGRTQTTPCKEKLNDESKDKDSKESKATQLVTRKRLEQKNKGSEAA